MTSEEMQERLAARADGLKEWLKGEAPECFEEQKHCDDGTQERVYWHYGYLVAVRDVLALLNDGQRKKDLN